MAALLAAGGSVFHHVVVYVKAGDQVGMRKAVGLVNGPACAPRVATTCWVLQQLLLHSQRCPRAAVLTWLPLLPPLRACAADGARVLSSQ